MACERPQRALSQGTGAARVEEGKVLLRQSTCHWVRGVKKLEAEVVYEITVECLEHHLLAIKRTRIRQVEFVAQMKNTAQETDTFKNKKILHP